MSGDTISPTRKVKPSHSSPPTRLVHIPRLRRDGSEDCGFTLHIGEIVSPDVVVDPPSTVGGLESDVVGLDRIDIR